MNLLLITQAAASPAAVFRKLDARHLGTPAVGMAPPARLTSS